jgi:hypothetical protein
LRAPFANPARCRTFAVADVIESFPAWEHCDQASVPEDDCICSKKLASRLISKLLVGSNESDLIEDLLWVLSADGQRAGIHQNQLDIGRVAELGPRSMAFTLPN